MNLPILLFVVQAVLISVSSGGKDGNKNDANGLHQSSKADHQNTGGRRTFIKKALVGLFAASSLLNGTGAAAVAGIPVEQVQANRPGSGVWKPESRDFTQYYLQHFQNNAPNLKSSNMEENTNKIVGNVGRRGLSKATNSAQKTKTTGTVDNQQTSDIFNDNACVVPTGPDPPRYEGPAQGN